MHEIKVSGDLNFNEYSVRIQVGRDEEFLFLASEREFFAEFQSLI